MRSGRPSATGYAYKDVLETLRLLDDLVVTRPHFLVGEFHEFGRDNASTRGSRSMYVRKLEGGRSALVTGLVNQLLQTRLEHPREVGCFLLLPSLISGPCVPVVLHFRSFYLFQRDSRQPGVFLVDEFLEEVSWVAKTTD